MTKIKGVTRSVDKLGRIVIPKSILKSLCISPGDDLNVYCENNKFGLVLGNEKIYCW